MTTSTITGIIILAMFGTTTLLGTVGAKLTPNKSEFTEAPSSISGEDIYVAWWTNNTANNNEEVMFRASSDGDATFCDKINISNTTNTDSWKAEIESDADPIMRVSNDNGSTFGPILMLANDGTITAR